ncbi:MFS transporter, partial [Parasphingorhabdus sp.]|uniref:MFS transporter n=1 Tax=Parasphingorhabdus sp. TaxID=2709688 RepID=UPI003C728CD1
AVSPGIIGLIGAGTNLGVGLGTFVFDRLKDKAGPMLLALGLAVAAIGYIGIGLSSILPMIGAFAILACIGSGILLPNMLTWTMRRLPAEMRGRGTGMWTGAFFLGQFLAPIVAASAMRATGGLANALTVYAGLIAIGAIAALLFARKPTFEATT